MQGWKKGVLLGLFSSMLWEPNTVEASIGHYTAQSAATAEATPWAVYQDTPQQAVPVVDWTKYLSQSSVALSEAPATAADAGIGSQRVLRQEHPQPSVPEQTLASRGEAATTYVPPQQQPSTTSQTQASGSVSNSTPTLMKSPGVSSTIGNRAVTIALKYLGVPYRYGGTSPSGFDCSGFTQYVYRQLGIELPRTTYQQITVGVQVSKANLRPGDLVFFSCNGQATSHSGIYVGNGKFVHADLNRGIAIADLDSSYWSGVYQAAVRVN